MGTRGRMERSMPSEHSPVSANQTVTYTFIANYLVWFALSLVLWMSFIPFLRIRRLPSRVLNWMSAKVGLTRDFRLTTILMGLALLMVALEYMNMRGRTK